MADDVKKTAKIGQGKAGPGRPPGLPNKLTRAFREAVQAVYGKIGGDEAFAKWARDNPGEFYKIAARMIPTEVTGAEGAPLAVTPVINVTVREVEKK